MRLIFDKRKLINKIRFYCQKQWNVANIKMYEDSSYRT